MCGITGIYNFNKEKAIDAQLLRKMTDIVSHRGPDGEGFYIKGNLGLGHRRLSIIDLETGDQPMFNNDKSLVLVLNGEIYNYIELREELIKLGHNFFTRSDTEVVIKAYEEWGVDCQKRFNGMWAFALWDSKNQQLFLSRDRIGEKPLHYSIYNNSLVFGSEMKSLFAYGIPKDVTYEMLEVYLVTTNIPEPYSFYKHIRKLPAGHYLIVKNGSLSEFKYWDLPEIDEKNMYSERKQVYENFRFLLEDSVRIRMRSDVPYGAFLSGGLDSSAIVALMSKISLYPIHTFTIGFEDKNFDESSLAAEIARKYATNHFLETVLPENFDSTIKKTSFHFDEPFGDSSAIPVAYVSKTAAQHVKMVLTGDGGDEVLSGYTSYQGIKLTYLIRMVPKPFRNLIHLVNDGVAPLFTGNIRYKLNRVSSVIHTSALDFSHRISEKAADTNFLSIKELTKDLKEVIRIEDYFSEFMAMSTYKHDFYKMMYLNFKYNLPNDYLVKVDRMSMANSLETRIPFLDYRLIEFMARVDKDIKMQGWERKSVLRNTTGKEMPKNVLRAPKKGFGIPLREWFKDDSISSVIDDNLSNLNGLLNRAAINKLVYENKLGERDNGNFIWTLMMLNALIR